MIDGGDTFGDITSAMIADEECENGAFCPICEISQPVLKIFVRGLCPMSIFNTVYMYNIDRQGEVLYLGESTSTIAYDRPAKLWRWYDKKNNMSVATSESLPLF